MREWCVRPARGLRESLADLDLPLERPVDSQATAGLLADGRHLAGRARDECESYRDNYNTRVPTKVSKRSPILQAGLRSLVPRQVCW